MYVLSFLGVSPALALRGRCFPHYAIASVR